VELCKHQKRCDDTPEGIAMKLIMTVTSITKLTDDKLLVQLQGQYGTSQLMLSLNQQSGLKVGQEFHLESDTGLPFIGVIDEVEQRSPVPGSVPQTMPRVPFTVPKPPKT
jgi:hypothetical protein